ncbi:MAG: arabinogalactan endo-1,4-beta-galactosidase [Treponema sp.]|nr:arabinogalactan endo-1,4-beta-galactosidase [Treponema sp.]
MKKILPSIIVALFFLSCQSGAGAAASSSPESSGSKPGSSSGSQFVRGFDASQVDFFEEAGVKWKDIDGKEKDFFEILKSHGVNTVRLRIWDDPSQFNSSINTGDNSLERTVKMARRVKNAGLSLLLDFHYSDTWADPGRQILPAAWKNLKTEDEVAKALSEYTTQVLTAIKNQAGIVPSYVQVGNEINSGLLLHLSSNPNDNNDFSAFALAGNSYGDEENFSPDRMVKYLKAGAMAVRSFDSSIKILLHLAGNPWYDDSWFFDPVKNAEVPFDAIGYSFYPWESSGMTISDLKKKIAFQKEKYGLQVMVVESSSHWNDEADLEYQIRTCKSMTDPSTGKPYSDLELSASGGQTYVKGTVTNQANVLRHMIDESRASGASGFFVWGGDLYGNYKWGMFDSSARALESLNEFLE